MFKIKDLKVSYKKNLVLDIKSFCFPKKGVVIINGANGSGKTTLFKALMNLIKYEGNIYYNDINIKKYKEDLYKKVCYIDQFGNLINYLTEDKNYKIVNECLDIESNNNYQNRKINKLSGGQRKIVEEKRLDINQYETFLLDEPTVSLDRKNKEILINKIKELSKEKLVVIITHDKEFKIENSISYDINDLSNECEIIDNDYKEMENKKYKTNFFKISFVNFFKHIIVFIFLAILSFFVTTCVNFYSYRPYHFSENSAKYAMYFPICKKEYVMGNNGYINEKDINDNVTNYRIYTQKGAYKIDNISYNEKNYLSIGSVNMVIVTEKTDKLMITDAVSYSYFGDYLDHTGETITYKTWSKLDNKVESKEYVIGQTIDTIFSKDITNSETYNIYDYCSYIIMPESEESFISTDSIFTDFGLKYGDKMPEGYVPYLTCYGSSKLKINVETLKPILLSLTVVSFLLFAYTFFAINLKRRKKLNDMFKLKSIAVSNNKILSILNIPFYIMSFLSYMIGLLSYVFIVYYNNKFEDQVFKNVNVMMFNIYIYPVIILFIILIIISVLRTKLLKNKIEGKI